MAAARIAEAGVVRPRFGLSRSPSPAEQSNNSYEEDARRVASQNAYQGTYGYGGPDAYGIQLCAIRRTLGLK